MTLTTSGVWLLISGDHAIVTGSSPSASFVSHLSNTPVPLCVPHHTLCKILAAPFTSSVSWRNTCAVPGVTPTYAVRCPPVNLITFTPSRIIICRTVSESIFKYSLGITILAADAVNDVLLVNVPDFIILSFLYGYSNVYVTFICSLSLMPMSAESPTFVKVPSVLT